MSAARIGELERRLGNLLRPGTIKEVDYANARVRVQTGGNVTAWLPWMTTRAGGNREWNAPEVGEQVLLLSPHGELAQGYVLPSIYQDAHPANGDRATVRRIDYADGAYTEYDRGSHTLTANLAEDGRAIIVTGDNTTEQTKDRTLLKLGDSASIEMTASAIKLTIGGTTLEIGAGGITANQTITVTGGDVVADGVRLKTHVHGGVETGPSTTSGPVT